MLNGMRELLHNVSHPFASHVSCHHHHQHNPHSYHCLLPLVLAELAHNVQDSHHQMETVMTALQYIQGHKSYDKNFFNGFAVGMMIQSYIDRKDLFGFEPSDFQDWMIAICTYIQDLDVSFDPVSNKIIIADDSIIISDSSYYLYYTHGLVNAKAQALHEYESFPPCDELPF